MGRSTKLEDLPEYEDEDEDEYEEPIVNEKYEEEYSSSTINELKTFLMKNTREIIIVMMIIVMISLGEDIINKIPMIKGEYAKAIVKAVLGGGVYFTGKYYLIE